MADDAEENPVEIELESLEAIYVNELSYKRKSDDSLDTIELLLHPATGGNKDEQFVCMTLIFTPSPKYPDEIPGIEIKNPRGLGEEEVASLVEDMVTKAKECVGEVMMFTLIEMAKDSLTEGNIPHCPCVVCLEHFHEGDLFHRTACYHYFHIKCLARYLEHSRRQIEEQREYEHEMRHREFSEENKRQMETIVCPLCRTPLGEDSLAFTIDCAEGDQHEADEPKFELPPDLKVQQAKMAELFARQKAKGGIIDLEQEKNRYLVNEEESRLATSTSQIQPSSPSKQEESLGKDLKNHKLSQRDSQSFDPMRGGRGRGHHNQHRERDIDSHNHQHARSHKHGHHHHHSGARHGSGTGNTYRGGSANKGSHHNYKQVKETKLDQDSVTKKEEIGTKNLHTQQTTELNSAICDNRISTFQSSECSSAALDVAERTGSSSRHPERKSAPNSYSRQRATGGNRGDRRGYGGRARGRGDHFTGERSNQHGVRKEDFETEQEMTRAKDETETLPRSPAEEGISSESEQDRFKEPRSYNNVRGKGRGRFREMDRAYFESETATKNGPNNCDKLPRVGRGSATRQGRGGCRERQKHNYRRDNEYDDSDRGNSRYYRGSTSSGRGYWKSGGAGHRSNTGSSNHYKSEESCNGEKPPQSNNLQQSGADIDTKVQQELDLNRKWRRLNFGYETSNVGLEVIDNVDDKHGHENPIDKKYTDESTSSKADMFIPSSTSANLNMYCVGYDEEEEEEDWDKESFPYAFERSYIRTEKLKEYDKFRKKDFEICHKKVQDRADRERLLREEERRMKREQAEKERKLENSSVSKPATKSVLELFQEKQEAKRKEAERLKQEQERQKLSGEKNGTESFSDEAFHSDDLTASSTSSNTGSTASLSSSSHGYRSQSSTEGLSHENVLDQTISANSEPTSASMSGKGKTGASEPASNEIKWVGVKQQTFSEPYDLIRGENDDIVRPGLDDPCIDAWERREELKRNGRGRRKKNNKKVEKCSVTDEVDLEMENSATNDVLIPSTDMGRTESITDDTLKIKNQSSNFSTPSNELTVTQSANRGLKQKALTKAPPLDLSKRNKRKPPSVSTASQPCSNLPDLTKKELAQLKALYTDEETTENAHIDQLHELSEKKSISTPIDLTSVKDEPLTNEVEPPPKDLNRPLVDSTKSYCSETSSNHEEYQGLQRENLSKPSNKPLKKAPPLNLKQFPKKKKCPEADLSKSITPEERMFIAKLSREL